MARWFVAVMVGIGAFANRTNDAFACSRVFGVLEDMAVGASVADVIVAVEALEVGGGRARVKVLEVLDGQVPDTVLTVNGPETAKEAPVRILCGVPTMEVGSRYLLLLWRGVGADPTYDLVDEAGGIQAEARRAELVKAIAHKRPAAPWLAQGPVATRLVVTSPPGAAELDLAVLARNISAKELEWRYASWPDSERSSCALSFVSLTTGKTIPAVPVPIAREDIAAYFSKHGDRYTLKLAPRAVGFVRLGRVTTAAQGWGYKEVLDFKYYPAPRSDTFAVSAECKRYLTTPFATGTMLLIW